MDAMDSAKDNLIHGGDWQGFLEAFGREPLDFSANVSPLGVPETVRSRIAASLERQDRYPDPLCRRLTRKIGEQEGVPPEWILCGNGAADLIWRIVMTLDPGTPALLTAPAFAEYEAALRFRKASIHYADLLPERNFDLPEDYPERIPEGGILFLCRPDNPTGRMIGEEMCRKVLETAADRNTLVVLDESFFSFLTDPACPSALTRLKVFPNLIVLKAFTKIYGMAGIRLGCCFCSDAGRLQKIREAGQPWAVSGIAQEAGLAALEDRAYVECVRKLIREERPILEKELADAGLRVIPGAANYILFQGPREMGSLLAERGILLRDCSNYRGLEPGWFRTAVRTREENRMLIREIRAVKEVLDGNK